MSISRKFCSSVLLIVAAAGPLGAQADYRKEFEELGGVAAAAEGCKSCHLGSDDPRFAAIPPVLKGEERQFADAGLQEKTKKLFPDAATRQKRIRLLMAHPRPDIVGPRSVHRDFDCRVCHEMADREELPPERRKLWREQFMTPHPEVKDLRLKPLGNIEAVCLKCHVDQEPLEGADLLTRGKLLYERMTCYACHGTRGMRTVEAELGPGEKRMRRPGPPLDRIASKVDKKWAYNWIYHPFDFKPTARMFHFFPRGPLGFPKEIIADVPAERAAEVERVIAACVTEYLFSASRPAELPELPAGILETEEWKVLDQQKRGARLALDVGCLGCHRLEENYAEDYQDTYLEEEFATNLNGSGDKFDSERGRRWLYAWLKNPSHWNPDTPMPDFRLTEPQIGDLIQFLLALKIDNAFRRGKKLKTWEPRDPPVRLDGEWAVGAEAILNRLVEHQKGPAEASARDKALWEGRFIVELFGCYACHSMGPEWDRRPAMQGSLDPDIIPPRGVMARMPLIVVDDLQSALTGGYLWAHVDALRPPARAKAASTRQRILSEGERLLNKYHCEGCHLLEESRVYVREEGTARPIETSIKARVESTPALNRPQYAVGWLRRADTLDFDPLKKKYPEFLPYHEIDRGLPPRGGTYLHRRLALAAPEEHAALVNRRPPPLRTVGRKLDPRWMAAFLKDPEPLRFQEGLRMPTFPFEPGEVESLVDYFRARDGARPEDSGGRLSQEEVDRRYDALRAADRALKTQCAACHSLDGAGGTIASELGRLHRRLQRPWLRAFLEDPASIYPGTAMPSLPKDLSAEDLADLLLNYEKFRRSKARLGGPVEAAEALATLDGDAGEIARIALLRAAEDRAFQELVEPAVDAALRTRTDVADELEPLLGHPAESVRLAALRGARGSPSLAANVEESLADASAKARVLAIQALASMNARDRAGAVASRLADPDAMVRRAALDALEFFEARDRADAVGGLVKDPEVSLRVRAAEVLGALGADRPLAAGLADAHPMVRWACLLALAAIGRAPAAAGELLKDGEPSVRAAAAACLIRGGEARAREALKAEAARRPYDELTERALRAAVNAALPGEVLAREIPPGDRTAAEWLKHLGAESDWDPSKLAARVSTRSRSMFLLLGEISKACGGVFVWRGGKLRLVPLEKGLE
jgi:mono/diheme cytochrome c family protein